MLPVSRAAYRPSISCINATQHFLRFNSTQNESFSLTSKVYPLDKDSISEADVDGWLQALQKLRKGKSNLDTESEIYLNQLVKPEEIIKEKFEPSEEQIKEVSGFQNQPIPLKYDPLVENFTNLIMRHGKKALARKIMTRSLYIIYLKTRLDPITILYETLDKLGPLLKTNVQKTGTAKAKIVPHPLTERQRYRYAMLWILQGAENKKSPDMSVRLAEEIINAYEGKSSGYEKQTAMHKLAIQNRANLRL